MSLTVDAGESVGLVGPNGAGKTTLFNCICGQLRPEQGEVELSPAPPSAVCRSTSGPGWASAAPTSGSRCSPT